MEEKTVVAWDLILQPKNATMSSVQVSRTLLGSDVLEYVLLKFNVKPSFFDNVMCTFW